jgi:hypothetical protein
MMRRTPLLVALSLLVVADCILTIVAVGHLGATELNPICGWTGLELFIVLKIAVSAGGIGMFAYFGDVVPRASLACIGVLCVLYSGVLVWNMGAFLSA